MASYGRRRTPWGLYSLIGAFVLFLGVGGTLATLVAAGIPLPFVTQAKPPRIRLPANFRPIEAYAQVTRDDLTHPEKRAIHTIELAPEQVVGLSVEGVTVDGEEVKAAIASVRVAGGEVVLTTTDGKETPVSRARSIGGVLLNVNEVIGRVVASDKSPHFAFREESFLPKGTRPGLSAGVPLGMQALTIETAKISGLHNLKRGDQVDLVAAVPTEALADFDPPTSRRPPLSFVAKTARENKKDKTTAPRIVAVAAIVVRPVHMRTKAETTSTLTQGKRVQGVPIEEVVLALRPEDVPQVELAVQRDFSLMAVTQTGRPAEASETEKKPTAMVEVLRLARPVNAFSALAEGDFVDPKTRRQDVDYLEPDTAKQRKVVPYRMLPGRVVKRNVEPGEILTEDDLLPIGTRPGVGAGVAIDRQAITLSTSKVSGAELLNVGDHIDLLGSFKLDVRELRERTTTARAGAVEERETSRLVRASSTSPSTDTLGGRGEHWHLAIDAVVLTTTAAPPTGTNEAPSTAVTLAVHPRDVESIAQSLAREDIHLAVAVRSSLPPDVEPDGVPRGYVRAPVCGERLRAFRPLNGWSATMRRVVWTYVPAEEAKSRALVADLAPFAGRMLKRNLQPGEFFSEQDFLPSGAAPGVAGAIPAGMRAVLLSRTALESDVTSAEEGIASTHRTTEFVKGLESLEPQQTVDVYATRRLASPDDATDVAWTGRASVTPVISGGIVLQTYQDSESDAVTGAMIAVSEDQAPALAEALATADEVRVFTKPTPDADALASTNETPAGFDPAAGAVRIEQVVGGSKRVRVFSAGKK